jgi:hypothetical protein
MVNRSQRGGNHLISQNIELFLIIAIGISAAADGAKLGCRIRPGDGRRQFNRNPGQGANRRRHRLVGLLRFVSKILSESELSSCYPYLHMRCCQSRRADLILNKETPAAATATGVFNL